MLRGPQKGFFFFNNFYFAYIGVLPVLYVCLWEGVGSWSFITDRCELPCGYLELNLGILEEQSTLLTAEPSPQPPRRVF